MTPKIFGVQFVSAVAVTLAVASPCAAQSTQPPPSANPFAGLFKGSPKDQKHRLDLSGSAFAAWDDNVLAQAPAGPGDQFLVDPRLIKQGIANGFQGSLVYGYHTNGTRSQFNADAQAGLQQFASSGRDPLWFDTYNAGIGLRTSFTPKVSLSLSGSASYAPFYQYAPFLSNTTSEESPVGTDYGYAVNSNWVRSTLATASLEDRFSKKTGVSVGVGWEQREMPDDPSQSLETRSVRAAISHNLTRKLAFHVGYAIQEVRYKARPDEDSPLLHNVDIGLGYGDGITISFARHYTLALSVGASVVKNGDPASVAATGRDTVFAINGAATLSRSIGRMWGASIGYSRGTSYIVGFTEPLTLDSANAGIGGPILGRLHFSAGGGASRGRLVFSQADGNLVSYTASTKLTFGLFKNLGLYTQASYYRYSVPPGFQTFGFAPDLDRRSVSAGLSAWLPLIKPPRVRRTNDPSEQSDRDTR